MGSGPSNGNKMEEAEEARRFEELVGDKVGKQLTVYQVFLVEFLILLLTVQLTAIEFFG